MQRYLRIPTPCTGWGGVSYDTRHDVWQVKIESPRTHFTFRGLWPPVLAVEQNPGLAEICSNNANRYGMGSNDQSLNCIFLR